MTTIHNDKQSNGSNGHNSKPITESDRWAAEERKAVAVERERSRSAFEREQLRAQNTEHDERRRNEAAELLAVSRHKRDLEFTERVAPLIKDGLDQMAKISADAIAARAATIVKLAEIDIELAREFMAEGRAAQDGALAMLAKVADAVIYKLKTE